MDVGIHAGVKPFIAGHAGNQLRVKYYLVEHRPLALQTQFFLRTREHSRHRNFGTGAGDGRHANVVHPRFFYQVKSLVIFRWPFVGEHQRYRLGDIHNASTANADDGSGQPFLLKRGVPYFINLVGGRLVGIYINEPDDILSLGRNSLFQCMTFEVGIHQVQHEIVW